jgi:hypothetical protein
LGLKIGWLRALEAGSGARRKKSGVKKTRRNVRGNFFPPFSGGKGKKGAFPDEKHPARAFARGK